MSLISLPYLNFNLGGVASIVNAPGIALGVQSAINYVSQSMLVLPKRINLNEMVATPLADKLTCDIKFRLPVGICRVTVVQAKELIDADFFNKSDPYCIVNVGTQSKRVNNVIIIIIFYYHLDKNNK